MRTRSQFGLAVLAIAVFVWLPGRALGQRPHADRPPESHPAQAPAHPQNQNRDVNRPPANQQRQQGSANGNARAPQSHYAPQAGYNNSYRPPNGAARPWVDTMRELTPAQRERVLQSSRAFQSLSPDKQNKIRQQFNQWDHMTPAQRQDLRAKEAIWSRLTPQQREHIKNDVLPRWHQMTWDRQQVIKQKLGVLQNMPESARNERLNDPNFTRGMSDDEKSMLRDLSHTHVGAPDQPNE